MVEDDAGLYAGRRDVVLALEIDGAVLLAGSPVDVLMEMEMLPGHAPVVGTSPL